MTSRTKSFYRKMSPSDKSFQLKRNTGQEDKQTPFVNYDLIYKRSNRRYSKSITKNNFFEDKINQIEKAYHVPESFLSQNLRIKQKIRDKSYHAMKQTQSEQKFSKRAIKPTMKFQNKQTQGSKQLSITKDKSFFNTNSLENQQKQQGLEELFYKQVHFAQRCKRISKGAK